MSCNITAFPTVATVIGLSPEALATSGNFVATIAVNPNAIMSNQQIEQHTVRDIKTGDPVSQAVVDNVLGKLPNKTEQVALRCEVCNVTVHGQHILEAHLAGTKHAKKLKAMELMKGLDHGGFVSNTIQSNPNKSVGFTCSICQVSVNSSLQLQAHLEGSKHKNKVGSSDANTTYLPTTTGNSGIGPGSGGQIRVDVGANRLYCAACNVTVNSDIQLHQHITSRKHGDKVNGRQSVTQPRQQRNSPYQRISPLSWPNSSNGEQHITSRKHCDKVNGRVKQPWQQRTGPYQRHSPQYESPPSWNRYPPVAHAPIDNNFVSGDGDETVSSQQIQMGNWPQNFHKDMFPNTSAKTPAVPQRKVTDIEIYKLFSTLKF